MRSRSKKSTLDASSNPVEGFPAVYGACPDKAMVGAVESSPPGGGEAVPAYFPPRPSELGRCSSTLSEAEDCASALSTRSGSLSLEESFALEDKSCQASRSGKSLVDVDCQCDRSRVEDVLQDSSVADTAFESIDDEEPRSEVMGAPLSPVSETSPPHTLLSPTCCNPVLTPTSVRLQIGTPKTVTPAQGARRRLKFDEIRSRPSAPLRGEAPLKIELNAKVFVAFAFLWMAFHYIVLLPTLRDIKYGPVY